MDHSVVAALCRARSGSRGLPRRVELGLGLAVLDLLHAELGRGLVVVEVLDHLEPPVEVVGQDEVLDGTCSSR